MCDMALRIDYADGALDLIVDVRPGFSGSARFPDFVAVGIVLVGVNCSVRIGNQLDLASGIILVGRSSYRTTLRLR